MAASTANRRPLLLPVLFAGFAWLATMGPVAVPAAGICGFEAIISAYEEGLDRLRAGDHPAARVVWQALAERGLAPAQRQLALLHATGTGVGKDFAEAYLWARLAALGFDGEGSRLARQLSAKLDPATREGMDKLIAEWRPAAGDCGGGPPVATRSADGRELRLGGLEFRADPRIADTIVGDTFDRAPGVFAAARERIAHAPLLLAVVEQVEITVGDRYDRYLGWKPGDGNVLEVAHGNFFDDDPIYFAHALVLEAARRLYEHLPDTELADPHLANRGGKRIHGSVYPDVDNRPFYESIGRVLVLAETLPIELRRNLEAVDTIRYNPPSEHFIKSGPLDGSVAFYNKILGREGSRIIFIRRDMRWSSDVDLLLSLVHEGTHARQDRIVEGYQKDLPRMNAALQRLEGGGRGGSAEAATLRREIDDKVRYAELWLRGRETANGRVTEIGFECEALVNEVKTARLVGGEPSSVEKSQYLALCEEARLLLVSWKDERLLGGRR